MKSNKKYNIYLDNASTTMPYIENQLLNNTPWGNPSSLHAVGEKSVSYLNKSKKMIGDVFNVDQNGILFTSGATEGNNIVIQSILNQKIQQCRTGKSIYFPHVVCSPLEHPSVRNIIKHYEDLNLIKCDYLPVDNEGHVILNNLDALLMPCTCLVTCMYVNNEIGSIQDINTIGVACKEKNIPFHVDATQAVGKLSIDMEKDNIDYLVFSGHKFHAFKGVGAIVCRNKSCLNDLTPLMFGGHQQFGLRPGTEDVERIFHMATVLNSEYQSIIEHQQLSYKFNLLLSNLFEEECFKNNINIIINSNDFRIPVFSISFKGLSGDFLVSELNNLGIYISTGSACTSGELEPSYVLQAIRVSDDYINGTIRISFDPYDDNLENKLKTVVNKIINLVK